MSRVVTMAELVLVMQQLSRQVGRCNGSRLPTGHTATLPSPLLLIELRLYLPKWMQLIVLMLMLRKPTFMNTYSNNSNHIRFKGNNNQGSYSNNTEKSIKHHNNF